MPKPAPVPLDAVSRFVLQLAHDVRNELAMLDLQAGLLAQLVSEREAADMVAEMQSQLTATANTFRKLALRFSESTPQRDPWNARDVFQYCRDTAHDSLGSSAADFTWHSDLSEESVVTDIALFASAWLELLSNAHDFREDNGHVAIRAGNQQGRVHFALHETKTSPPDFSGWGAAPFQTTRRGGYGLGLYCAHRTLAALGNECVRRHDSETATFITTVVFPA